MEINYETLITWAIVVMIILSIGSTSLIVINFFTKEDIKIKSDKCIEFEKGYVTVNCGLVEKVLNKKRCFGED